MFSTLKYFFLAISVGNSSMLSTKKNSHRKQHTAVLDTQLCVCMFPCSGAFSSDLTVAKCVEYPLNRIEVKFTPHFD